MSKNKLEQKELLATLHKSLAKSVDLLGHFLEVDRSLVPSFIRSRACLRRFNLCFFVLLEYFKQASDMPDDFIKEKQPEDFADYFIEKGVMNVTDKEIFVELASLYAILFASPPGTWADEHNIMELIAHPMYEFLKRTAGSMSANVGSVGVVPL